MRRAVRRASRAGWHTQSSATLAGKRIESSTENIAVMKALLAEFLDRGLDPARARLWMIDGAKALRRATREFFGETAPVQRCQLHKRRKVLGICPSMYRRACAKR